jgi:cell wall-associated NlpC family hydrolase
MSLVNRLGLLVVSGAIWTTACASTGGVPRPFPGAPAPPGTSTAGAPAVPLPPVVPADRDPAGGRATTLPLIDLALSYRGVPYRNGGSDPATGFDCSGFVQWVFAQSGKKVPREVHDQYEVGKKIDEDDVQPGDLVFFHTEGKGASHVGIAIGNNQFVHAPSSRGVVRVENYTVNYWDTRFVGARRIE